MTDAFITRTGARRVGMSIAAFGIDTSDPDPAKWYAHGSDQDAVDAWNKQHAAEIAAQSTKPTSSRTTSAS